MSSKKITECLEITNPDLIKEWDYKKNENIFPKAFTRTSKCKVWWKCQEGHSWNAAIYARARCNHPTGCPYCKGNLPIIGENDFATMFPELLLDWDFEKNSLIPSELTAHSCKRVYWRCHLCGHSWNTKVNNRTSNKRGCPNCTLKSTSFAEQALFFYTKKLFPSAINRYKGNGYELDIYIPDINTGIEYDGYYYHNSEESIIREIKKYNLCKKNGIRLIRAVDSKGIHQGTADSIIGVNAVHLHGNLNTIIRLILKDIDPASNLWTQKSPKQIWSTVDSLVNVDKDYFEIISDKRLRMEENSVFYSNPELLKEWDYDTNGNANPFSFTAGTGIKVGWKCGKCGYKWNARIPDRIKNKGCPCCNRLVLVKGVNDFATLYPSELSEWDYEKNEISPSEVLGYTTKCWWRCGVCGNSWQATIQDKVIREDKTGCPKCGRRIVAQKRHQRAMDNGGLFERFPQMIIEWDYEKNAGVDPWDIAYGSGKKYWWKCVMCGNSWQVSPNNRSKNHGCPKCRHRILEDDGNNQMSLWNFITKET